MLKEIEAKIDALLTQNDISVSVRYVGETNRAFADSKNLMDEWRFVFTKNKIIEEFEYFTGVGHRSKMTDTPKGRVAANDCKNISKTSLYYLAKVKEFCKPVAPHPTGLIHCALSESEACNMSFANWCDDFGYDTDSRKAFNTYEACQQNGDKLKRIFNHIQREELRETLQDY